MLLDKIELLETTIKDDFFRSRLTYREVAKALNITSATVSRAVLGHGTVKFETVKRIAAYIDSKRA